MIKAKDLRIGNLVNTRRGDQACIDILCDCVNFHNLECEPYDLIVPIPLTEEWLVRFGFINLSQTTDYYFEKGNFILGGRRRRLLPSVHCESGLEAFGNEIKYVHELQNLIFALTKQELELKQ